jgi:hypothetical protein
MKEIEKHICKDKNISNVSIDNFIFLREIKE